MSKVRAFDLPGHDAWFNAADHLPPHFHVEKPGEWQIKVMFRRDRAEMFEMVWPKNPRKRGGKPRRAELVQIADKVESHRAELLEQWERDVNATEPGPER